MTKAFRSNNKNTSNKILLNYQINDIIEIDKLLTHLAKNYQENISKNDIMYKTITAHHRSLAQSSSHLLTKDDNVLGKYADAAKKMGHKRWLKSALTWCEEFIISYYRKGKAKKYFIRNNTYGESFSHIPNDLFIDPITNESRKIKLIDIGSCYNPLSKSISSHLFDITALDLFPAEKNVLKCDFLELLVGPVDSSPVINDSNTSHCTLLQLPKSSYDVALMSLVLSYLPNPKMRMDMIRKARCLLKSSSPNPSYNSLLVIVEKESIFKHSSSINGIEKGLNMTLLADWKQAIVEEGFTLLRYNKLSSDDGRKCHVFVFKYASKETNVIDTSGNDNKLYIKQDFDVPKNNYPVVIVGAGIGGLSLAAALKQYNIPFKVYEKDIDFNVRKQGYALTIQQGISALSAMGIDIMKDGIGLTSTNHTSLTVDGELLGTYGRGNKDEGKNRYNIHIPRQKLRSLLYSLVGEENVCWNKNFSSFSQTSTDCVNVQFSDGMTIKSSLLVAADGIYSAVRQRLLNDSKLNYTGFMLILGISNYVPIFSNNADNKFQQIQWVNGYARVYSMPFSETQTFWQMSFPLEESEAKLLSQKLGTELIETAVKILGNSIHEPLKNIISKTNLSLISAHPAYDREPLKYPIQSRIENPNSRVTLIGDSAHPMLPFKAQGANSALLDGLNLAKCIFQSKILTNETDFALLGQYERLMIHRSTIKILKSRLAAINLHTKSVLQKGNITRAMAAEQIDD